MPVPAPVKTSTQSLTSPSSSSSLSATALANANALARPERTPTFDDQNEILHRVEFDAPLSADLQPLTEGRFSIDFSLDLERQLASMESPPVTPAHDATSHRGPPPQQGQMIMKGGVGLMRRSESQSSRGSRSTNARMEEMDILPEPEVLAHIVTQLRQSLAEMTKERDELVKMVEKATAQEANVADALGMMTEKATAAEEELGLARKKMREDEDQIVLLRAKVEESRRGLMRLQTESRRQSMAPIDVNRASQLSLAGLTSPPSSKRASFTPLTGSKHGHRRISSVSDSAFLGGFPTPDLTPSPNGQNGFGLASADSMAGLPPSSARRFSGLFGRQSPPEGSEMLQTMVAADTRAAEKAELEALRVEMKTLKETLESVKHELAEANEAKEASETCVSALREFIAENNYGATAVKLPPPPTMANGDEEPKKTGSGWGFKLWGSGSGGPGGGVDSPLRSSAPPLSAAPAGSHGVPPTPIGGIQAQPTISAAPPSRKLTGLFSSRSSVSSNHTSTSRGGEPLPPLQTGGGISAVPPKLSQRDSMYSYSDASSVAEPVSPGSDINGLGTAGYGAGAGAGAIAYGQVKVHPGISEEGEGPVRVQGRMEKELGTPLSLHEVDLHGLR